MDIKPLSGGDLGQPTASSVLELSREKEFDVLIGQISQLTLRRQAVTTTYMAVNAAVATAVAFLFKDGHLSGIGQIASVIILLLSGICACYIWRSLIRQISTALGWWYGRLRELEVRMSGSPAYFTQEFYQLYDGPNSRYGLTRLETNLTYVFTFVYSVFVLFLTIYEINLCTMPPSHK